MKTNSKNILEQLLKKGVRIPCPDSVEIGPEVSLGRISGDGVIIHSGCKIFGSDTLIMEGAQLGYETPAAVSNCQLGCNVKLKGGFFHESVFLDGASLGSGAQVREACIFEEGAKGAHTVGLKHTILFPFVTLGSLINFCDCLMAGGTDEKNHSEVGSSYIHFNYTPNQDKATPSLMGDVPRGVMVDQDPIFLGGQGGLVGPVVLEYGTYVAAGTIVRKDILRKNVMLLGNPSISKTVPFRQGLYTNIKRIVKLNTVYISNLIALRRWYLDVRRRFMNKDQMGIELHRGAVKKLEMGISERIRRLSDVASKMPQSIELIGGKSGQIGHDKILRTKKEFFDTWPKIEESFRKGINLKGDSFKREKFLSVIDREIDRKKGGYIEVIQGLDKGDSNLGTEWLQGLVDEISRDVFELLPEFGIK